MEKQKKKKEMKKNWNTGVSETVNAVFFTNREAVKTLSAQCNAVIL